MKYRAVTLTFYAVVLFAAPAAAQFNPMQLAALAAWKSGRPVYSQLPLWNELSAEQHRLVRTATTCPSGDWPACWEQLSEDARAVFFMITYSMERTLVGGAPLIRHVQEIEGILVPQPSRHHHSPTNVTKTVDGWRIHLMLNGLTPKSLSDWDRGTGTAHGTHSDFDYTVSFRDHRERDRFEGPFLQLVLNAASNSSDSDLDRGAYLHLSSPRDLYPRFRRRYLGVQNVLKIR